MSAPVSGRRAVGVFGGTFDPVHNAHLRVATEALERLGLDEVRLVPCHVPPHRGEPGATAAQRLEMLCSAVAGQPGLVVDTCELDRAGPSYMVDTLAALRAELGNDTALVLLVGADAFAGLTSWHRWRELGELAHIVVLTRPGTDSSDAGDSASWAAPRRIDQPAGLRASPAGRVLFWPVTQLDISATHIRALIAAGQTPRHLVPEPVRMIIERSGLYRP